MLENRNSVSGAPSVADASPAATSESGFRGFNRTGREDTTSDVLRPQAAPGLLLRRAIMLGIVVVLLAIVGYLAFSRSHLTLGGAENTGPSFNTPEHSEN